MKKIIIALCSIPFIFLNALPVGNPSTSGLLSEGFIIPENSGMNIRFGYLGNFVSDRRLKQKPPHHGDVDSFKITNNAGSITLNFFDRLDLFADLGASKITTQWRVQQRGLNYLITAKTDHNFSWSIGTNILLLQWRRTNLGIGGSYFRCDPPANTIIINGFGNNPLNSVLHYREWQANLGLSHKLDFFIPYVGIKYSRAKNNLETNLEPLISIEELTKIGFRSRSRVGLYLGCSLTTGELMFLNIEARLIDEEAVTVSFDVRF